MFEEMVQTWRANGIVTDDRIAEAFVQVDRAVFVLDEWKSLAYTDTALPLISGQTISQPTTIAMMLGELGAGQRMNVLEVGVGSGYVAALLSWIVGYSGSVFAVDIRPELVRLAEENIRHARLLADNVHVVLADGRLGLPGRGPFDRILVSAGGDSVPDNLVQELSIGGVLVMPVGDERGQVLVIVRKDESGVHFSRLRQKFQFVPLV